MLLSCGDALIDFLPVKSADERDALVPVVGGSCLNVAVGLARLGAPAGFVGGISSDLFGRMIAEHAEKSRVNLRYAARSSRPTTLAFVRAVDGEAHYAFYDEGTVSRHWTYRPGAIPFAEIDAIHVGSTTLVDGRLAAETLKMIDDARGSSTISFDPNCRPSLIGDKTEYVRRMDQFAAGADIVRLSDSDFDFLYGGSDPVERAEALFTAGTALLVITRGAQGVETWHREAGMVEVEAARVDVVDTIGAGDSFQAGLLFALRAIDRLKTGALAHMSADELHCVLAFAAACAAVTCGRPGADPPHLAEIDAGPFDALRGKCRAPG
jgi:fructokinase